MKMVDQKAKKNMKKQMKNYVYVILSDLLNLFQRKIQLFLQPRIEQVDNIIFTKSRAGQFIQPHTASTVYPQSWIVYPTLYSLYCVSSELDSLSNPILLVLCILRARQFIQPYTASTVYPQSWIQCIQPYTPCTVHPQS